MICCWFLLCCLSSGSLRGKHTCVIWGYADVCEHVQLQRSKRPLEVLSGIFKKFALCPLELSMTEWCCQPWFWEDRGGTVSQGGECCQNCLGLHSHRTGVGNKLSFLAEIALEEFSSPHFYFYFLYTYFHPPLIYQAAKAMQHAGCQEGMVPSSGAGHKNKSLVITSAVVHGLDWGHGAVKQAKAEKQCFLPRPTLNTLVFKLFLILAK